MDFLAACRAASPLQARPSCVANHLAFVLCHCRQDMNCEPIRGRHVHGNEIDAALHQVGDKCYVAGKPIKAGDQEHGAALAAFLQGGAQLRSVAHPPPAFDLGELRHELAGLTDVAVDRLALRVRLRPLAPCRSVETR